VQRIALGQGLVALAVGVPGIGVVDRGILAVLAVVVGLVPAAGDAVPVEGRGWHVYPGARGLEAPSRRPVLDLPEAARVVDEAVLAVHLAARVLGLDLVAAVRGLEAVAVAAVFVVPVPRVGPRGDALIFQALDFHIRSPFRSPRHLPIRLLVIRVLANASYKLGILAIILERKYTLYGTLISGCLCSNGN
jgi:hypothetical protein